MAFTLTCNNQTH